MKSSMIKDEFVRRVFEDHSERWLKNQESLMLSKRLNFHTNRLRDDRELEIVNASELNGRLEFTHPDYERFLDMKRSVRRKRGEGFRTKRGYQIHNRPIFGHFFSIGRDLMFGLTNDVKDEIKRDLIKNA